jgi:cephalosporin-C deacetylase-like acetyl esterase
MTFFDVKSQLQRVIYERTVAACEKGDRRRDGIRTVEELEEYRSKMRAKLFESMGGLPRSDTELNPRTSGVVDCDGFTIEKVVFESRPGIYVTSNLYLPDDTDGPGGAVLFLCGHALEGKHHEDYQVVCQYLAKAGLAVLAQDPIGQGERLSYYEPGIEGPAIPGGSAEHSYAGCRCLPLGQSLIRYFVHDSMRSLDYLAARSEVDPRKIGITGSSGGGTQTCAVMLCDPRIAAAAPCNFLMSRSSYLYSGGAQDSEQIWPGFTADG